VKVCMAELRRNFWIISANALCRKVVSRCKGCFRFNSKPLSQLMADLPEERIVPSPAFTHTGLDFAGPLLSKGWKDPVKVYLAIFVCFATKAVHVEVVSSLDTSACGEALKRFCARRGLPAVMYSDNGTNFVGTRNELLKVKAALDKVFPHLAAERNIEWKMIPQGSPHMGGLWESAVKSVKLHMKKTIGKTLLNFEEMTTFMCDVEAIMNSRPLVAISDDPRDLCALTPNMLVTGKPFLSMPIPEETRMMTGDFSMHPTKRWAHLNNLAAIFWRRWTKEYVTTLQPRVKWAQEQRSLKEGDLVLVTDERDPPLSWPMGRILKIFPGNDKTTRVALLKTSRGECKRPTVKLRLLPIKTDTYDPDEVLGGAPVDPREVVPAQQ
jgi:transposase InsO family protein